MGSPLQRAICGDKWSCNYNLEDTGKFLEIERSCDKKEFELSFKEYHVKIATNTHYCSRLEIPDVAVKLQETIKYPDCPWVMEIFIIYKCCHNENTANDTH